MGATTTTSPLLRSLLGNGQSTDKVEEILSSFNSTAQILTTTRPSKLNDLDIHRSNIIWPEDPIDEMPVK